MVPPFSLFPQAWTLLSIFLSTIVALVMEPLPVGACAFIAATVCLVTKSLNFVQTFSAFRNDVIWMIVVSFFFARGRLSPSRWRGALRNGAVLATLG